MASLGFFLSYWFKSQVWFLVSSHVHGHLHPSLPFSLGLLPGSRPPGPNYLVPGVPGPGLPRAQHFDQDKFSPLFTSPRPLPAAPCVTGSMSLRPGRPPRLRLSPQGPVSCCPSARARSSSTPRSPQFPDSLFGTTAVHYEESKSEGRADVFYTRTTRT